MHYALLKRRMCKQFRRSLKTKDRKLADRRLNDLRAKIGCLKISADAKLNFEQTAHLWLETNKHALSSNTVKRRKMYIKGLTPYFRNLPIRNITPQNCDRWVAERGAALASETFVHELDVMKTVFEFALERGLILSNPAKHIKRRKVISKQIVVPSLDQFKQIVSAIRLSDGKKDNQKKVKTAQTWLNSWRIRERASVKLSAAAMPTKKDLCSGPMFILSAGRFSCPAQRPRPRRAPSRCRKD